MLARAGFAVLAARTARVGQVPLEEPQCVLEPLVLPSKDRSHLMSLPVTDRTASTMKRWRSLARPSRCRCVAKAVCRDLCRLLNRTRRRLALASSLWRALSLGCRGDRDAKGFPYVFRLHVTDFQFLPESHAAKIAFHLGHEQLHGAAFCRELPELDGVFGRQPV